MILIVDDKNENLFSLQKLLEIHHFKVDTANSGEEALKKVLKNFYALIILDVQMPGMDGFEIAEAISGFRKSRDIPIIFLSAVKINKAFITKGYHSGGIDYVTKPFDPDLLLLKVKTFYRLSEQRRELNEIQIILREEIEFRKRAEKELSHSIEELRSVLESIPQIAFITDAGGGVEFANQHWYRYASGLSAFPRDERGQSVKRILEAAILSGEQQVVEVRICETGSQQFRYHRLSMTPVKKDKTIVRWVNIFTDIDDQKMANQVLEQRVAKRTEELHRMNIQLESSNHDLQQYASVASHDLKEPLRKIQIYGDRLRRLLTSEANSPAEAYIGKIITSSQRMTTLINDLLNYSRLSGDGHFQVVNVNGIIEGLVSDLELLVADKQAVIRVDTFPEMEVIPGQIRQLFQNIISNSIKFSRYGVPPVIDIRVETTDNKKIASPAAAGGVFCRIQISDNGIGFNEAYKDKIFTMFQRLHSKETFEGTGIGLAIVKKIIDKHNGAITVQSKEGEGTTFTIILPVSQQHTVHTKQIRVI